ncbi:hypothetical protein CVT25_002726 [Psilocybe cyanescens]|uniref:Uncharacterized protein n=1 Tax=Psilocybe cyanescens TaxID=93625 RepID=A0A409XUM2_PSICY|nr:hypothetical protein CVT25_002726 [Psilocybe cyanescens]
MSFIDTPTASSSSTPANSCLQGKQPAVPCYAQTLSTFEALDLFADDETAQKICSYFEHPDTILAIDNLVKVARAHQQEEQEIRLARLRSRARQTMATILLDQLQSWGLEREIHDVLRKHYFASHLHSLKISHPYASTSTISKNNDSSMKLVQCFIYYNKTLNERNVGHLLPM